MAISSASSSAYIASEQLLQSLTLEDKEKKARPQVGDTVKIIIENKPGFQSLDRHGTKFLTGTVEKDDGSTGEHSQPFEIKFPDGKLAWYSEHWVELSKDVVVRYLPMKNIAGEVRFSDAGVSRWRCLAEKGMAYRKRKEEEEEAIVAEVLRKRKEREAKYWQRQEESLQSVLALSSSLTVAAEEAERKEEQEANNFQEAERKEEQAANNFQEKKRFARGEKVTVGGEEGKIVNFYDDDNTYSVRFTNGSTRRDVEEWEVQERPTVGSIVKILADDRVGLIGTIVRVDDSRRRLHLFEVEFELEGEQQSEWFTQVEVEATAQEVKEIHAQETPTQPEWTRFATDESHRSFWWWREVDNDSFLENEPGKWVKCQDPQSKKIYWWFSDEKWFWVHSGSATC